MRANKYLASAIYFWNAAAVYWRLNHKTESNRAYLLAIKNFKLRGEYSGRRILGIKEHKRSGFQKGDHFGC